MENNTLDSEANKLVESPLRMQIKDAIKETCMDTTLHGIPHILDATNHVTLRIIWILATLTSFGACFYFVIQSILSYLHNIQHLCQLKNITKCQQNFQWCRFVI